MAGTGGWNPAGSELFFQHAVPAFLLAGEQAHDAAHGVRPAAQVLLDGGLGGAQARARGIHMPQSFDGQDVLLHDVGGGRARVQQPAPRRRLKLPCQPPQQARALQAGPQVLQRRQAANGRVGGVCVWPGMMGQGRGGTPANPCPGPPAPPMSSRCQQRRTVDRGS